MSLTLKSSENEQYAQRLIEQLSSQGAYESFKILEDGTVCAIGKLLFTTALYMDLNAYGAEQRYCYPRGMRAYEALEALKSVEDIPMNGFIAFRGVDAARKVQANPEALRAYECAKQEHENGHIKTVKKEQNMASMPVRKMGL